MEAAKKEDDLPPVLVVVFGIAVFMTAVFFVTSVVITALFQMGSLSAHEADASGVMVFASAGAFALEALAYYAGKAAANAAARKRAG